MRALIDGDVIVYQAGFAGQWKDGEGDLVVRDFEEVTAYIAELVESI